MADDVNVKFGADIAELESKMSAAHVAVSGATTKMTDAIKSFGVAMAGALTVGAFQHAINGSLEMQDSLSKLSVKTGVTVENLAGLKLVAEMSGVSLEGAATGMKLLAKNMSENADMFAKLGVSAKDPQEVMIQLADKFVGIKDPADRTALAMKLFGRAGVEMLPMLMSGSVAMRGQIAAGTELSGVTTQSAKAAEAFNDKLSLMHARTQGMVNTVTGAMLPALNGIADAFANDKKNGEALNAVAAFLSGTLRTLASIGLIVRDVFLGVGDTIGAVAAAAVAAASGEFSQAGQILDEMSAKTKARGENLRATLKTLWTDIPQSIGDTIPLKETDLRGVLDKGNKKSGNAKAAKDESQMPQYEAALDLKRIEMIEQQHRELSKAEEKAYWDAVLLTVKAGSKDYDAVLKKSRGDRLADAREKLKEEQALEEERNKREQAIANDALATHAANIKQRRAMGEIDAMQEIEATRQLEQAKYAVQMQYAQAKLAKQREGTVEYAKAAEEIAVIDRQHNAAMVAADNAAALESRKAWMDMVQPISNAIETSVKGVIQGTQSIKQAFANLAQNIALSITSMIIKTNIELAASKLFQLGGGGAAGGASSGGLGGMLTAGLGAIFGGGGLFSSAGGEWNVPQDRLNLVHKNETILPASMAEKFRDMVSNGGGGRSTSMQTVNNFSLSGNVDRATQDQIAMLASGAMAQSMRRNG